MTKKPHIALTPQEEVTAPMPLPALEPNAIPVVAIPANVATARITPPGISSTFRAKESEAIPGVQSGALNPTPKLFTRTPRSKRTTPYSSILDPVPPKVDNDEEGSVVVEAIHDAPQPIQAETSDGTVAPIDSVDFIDDETVDKTAATAVPTLNIEHRATVLYWLVNLAREQGLYRARAKTREDQDLIHLVRVMITDEPTLHEYSIEDDASGDRQMRCRIAKGTPFGQRKHLHSIELTVYDWPKFETWMKKQHQERFRDMTTLDMLDSEIRIASWAYLDWLMQVIEEKSASGHAMFKTGQSVPLLNL
jgi:hypothetical protein